jgi:PAS domain S-box-containing protein
VSDFRTNSVPPEGVAATGVAKQKDPTTLLHQSEQMVAALLASASQAILTLDRTGRILVANAKAEEMFGYTREELIGAQIDILLPKSKRHAHRHQREEYFAKPRTRPMGIGMELSGCRKDGAEFPVEVSLSYVETTEGVIAMAFVNDISQRKHLEAQLLQAQKMDAVGRLAGGIAHDFNNMLTVIEGYNRMILDELSAVDPLREYADEVHAAAERAGALTNQLLAFSRRQIIQPRIINVNTCITQVEKMLRRLISEDIELVLNLQPQIGNIKADSSHFEQAIVNLVVNARDAMPTGGRVIIETTEVQLDETYARSHIGVQPGPFVMIAVSDTGQGMDAETREKIFEPFFTTKGRGKGTGLGLATVYGTVKQVGGDIWVYSEPGKGTTLKLYFPLVTGAVGESTPGEAQQSRVVSGETILVVEDEKAVRDLTVRMLGRLGYTVLTAAGGAEAIEIANAHAGPISLLLTDVIMPNMSGRQVADRLLALRPEIKVLYLSGYTDTSAVHHGVLESGVHFLTKPFSREVLSRKIREVLARS